MILFHEQQYDIVLSNSNSSIIDGTGRPALTGDVAIRSHRFAAIGDLKQVRAKRRIDASGLAVNPGLIHVHSHDDAALISAPDMRPKLTQGVASVMAGNCGISAGIVTSARAGQILTRGAQLQ